MPKDIKPVVKTKKRTLFAMSALAAIVVTLMFRGYDSYQANKKAEAEAAEKARQVQYLEEQSQRQVNCQGISRLLEDRKDFKAVASSVSCETEFLTLHNYSWGDDNFDRLYYQIRNVIISYRAHSKKGSSCAINKREK